MGFNFREEIYFLFRCRIEFLNIFRENDSRRKLNSLFYFFRLRRTVKFSFSWKTCMRDLKFHNRIVIALFYMFSLYRVSIIYVSKVARMENKFLRYTTSSPLSVCCIAYCRPRFLKYFQVNSVESIYIGCGCYQLDIIYSIWNWNIFTYLCSYRQQLLSPIWINVFTRILKSSFCLLFPCL